MSIRNDSVTADRPVRSVLFVSHAFPPAAGSGVQRTLGFVRHLPDAGWLPVVITVRHPVGAGWDKDLLDQVPREVVVVRAAWPNPGNTARRLFAMGSRGSPASQGDGWVPSTAVGRIRAAWGAVRDRALIPDDALTWYPFAVVAGLRAIHRLGVSALYSTSPPATNHLVARALHRRTRLPWLADFRDLWTETPYAEMRRIYRYAWRLPLERRLEASILSEADRVVTVTEPFRASFLSRTSALDPRRAVVITNGFEPSWTIGLERRPPDRFTIAYTGKFYGKERSPARFLQMLARLIRDGTVDSDRVRLRFLGISFSEVQKTAAGLRLEGVVSASGQVSHKEAIQAQLDASVLLLVIGDAPGERDSIPVKLFEYLDARRPILALAPLDSPAAQVVQATKAGRVVDPNDDAGIGAALMAYYRKFEKSGDVEWTGDPAAISGFARPKLAGDLAALLDTLVATWKARGGAS